MCFPTQKKAGFPLLEDFFMNNFIIVLSSVAVMLLFLLCGLISAKASIAQTEHAKSLSGILMYVFAPAMLLSSFLSIDFTLENTVSVLSFFLVTLILQTGFFLILFLVLRKKFSNPKFRILTVASFMGNVGFFGMPLVTALFPNDPVVACYACANMLSMNVLVYTVGSYLITYDKKYISAKNIFFNPTSVALLIAIPLCALKIKLPDFLFNAVSLLGKMTTPTCMIVLGMRLASIKPKTLVSEPFSYLSCFFKLIVFPLFCYLIVSFLPFLDEVAKTCVLVLAATPSAAFILTIAELHECERELSADAVLLATVFSLITLPLLLLIV